MRYYQFACPLSETARAKLTFQNEVLGVTGEQLDCRLSALVAGQVVGMLDYSIWRGEVAIKMIKVPEPQNRRHGYATALLQELQRHHPETEIAWGSLTDDGAKLKAQVPTIARANPEVQSKLARLAQAKAEEAELQAWVDSFDDHPSDEQRQALHAKSDHWNDLHDEIWHLEDELRDQTSHRMIIHHEA